MLPSVRLLYEERTLHQINTNMMNVCYSDLLHARRTNYRIQGVFELSCNGALSEKLPFSLKFGLYRNLFYSGLFYPYFTGTTWGVIPA